MSTIGKTNRFSSSPWMRSSIWLFSLLHVKVKWLWSLWNAQYLDLSRLESAFSVAWSQKKNLLLSARIIFASACCTYKHLQVTTPKNFQGQKYIFVEIIYLILRTEILFIGSNDDLKNILPNYFIKLLNKH